MALKGQERKDGFLDHPILSSMLINHNPLAALLQYDFQNLKLLCKVIIHKKIDKKFVFLHKRLV